MNIGDLFRVLGGATVAGLGTAEEQRQRQDKATQMAMVVEHQRRQEEATQIRHMQDLLERASYHQGVLAARPPVKPEGLWDPRTLAPVGEALPSAPLPVLAPGVPATPAISDENRLNYPATPAVPEVRAIRGSPGDVAALLRARTEQARERVAPIPHIPNLSLVPDPNAPGGFRQVGTPPERQPAPHTFTREGGEVVARPWTREGGWGKEEQVIPPSKASLDEIRTRRELGELRLESAQAQKNAGAVLQTIRAGGNPGESAALKASNEVKTSARKSLDAAAELFGTAEATILNRAAADLFRTAQEIDTWLVNVGKPKVSIPTDEASTRVASQRIVEELFGKDANWGNLAPPQKQQVLDRLNTLRR